MDCNKEEAVRAKALAEKKLQSKDFQGARKVALRAQQLYAGLENISQMLMVCDIHCSAEKKVGGTEMDWYGILQLERTADEATIKKQFRKFALQLHPDKNKFPGAEAAFKLVGEAQRVLLDREKRRAHDMKRNTYPSTAGARGASFSRASAPHQAPLKPKSNSSNGVQMNFGGNFAGFNAQHTTPPGFPNCRQTFWTACPFCSVRYQYYRETVDKSLSCQNCQKNFVAYDLNVPGTTPNINVDSPRFPQQEPLPKHGYSKVELSSKGASRAEIRRPEVPKKTGFQNATASAYKVENRKRGRKLDEESSESIDSESSSESEEDEKILAEDGQSQANQSRRQPVRRSARQRQQVSYKDNFSDDDDDGRVNLSKRAKGEGQSSDVEKENPLPKKASKPTIIDLDDKEVEEQKPSDGSDESLLGDDSENLGMKTEENSEIYEYPDPDFNDFDKVRAEGCFSVGQIWAAYDTLEGMPRFYARIRKVFSPFRLKVTWLEPDPEKEDERKWVEKDLPVSCGRFGSGHTEETEDKLMFSHRMHFEACSHKTHIIYPNVGETWAIFKNWDIRWYCDPNHHKKFEFDFVEILSEYSEKDGVHVAYLRKVKGFTSLFVQTSRGGRSIRFRPEELYRFSHRVPSFRLTGEEREGVPKGCFELDPAAIPMNIEEIDLSSNHDSVKPEPAAKGECSQADKKATPVSRPHSPSSPVPEPIQIPDSEFHNFDNSKSPENFQIGQVWAAYCDEDSLPKYYCQIMKVYPSPQFKVHVRWLSLCMLPNDVTCWENKEMPISCGKFKLKKGNPAIYRDTAAFSHRMKAARGKSGFLEIFPEKGDVWAMYRSWDPGMRCSDLQRCEYDLVEVMERSDSVVKVSVLERVDGFSSVFRSQLRGGLKVTREIPMADILKFAHQVPAVQLAEERNGSLRGCWELDPAALPIYFFGSK